MGRKSNVDKYMDRMQEIVKEVNSENKDLKSLVKAKDRKYKRISRAFWWFVIVSVIVLLIVCHLGGLM